MLADPRSASLVTNFAAQWLYLRNLPAVSPDFIVFPDFDETLRRALRRETELFFDSVMRAGFWPDTISTDGNAASRGVPGVVDLPNVMSKFLDAGMTLDDVVACVTVNAARVFQHLNERGTLHVGAPAGLALLEMRVGVFDFVDNYENLRAGGRRLFPRGTVLGGRWIPRA